MVNKCVAFGCNSGYASSKENVPSFRFPTDKSDLMEKWVKFVNRADWIPTKNSVLCCKHFDSQFIKHGKKNKLQWKLNPVPTIHTEIALQQSSSL